MSLKELIAKATKGPWRYKTSGNLANAIEGYCGRHMFDGDDGYRTIMMYQAAEPTGKTKEEKENAEANRDLTLYLINRAPAIAELIEAAEAVGAHPFVYFGTDTLPGPDSGQHKIAALRKALEAMKCS